MTGTGPSSPRLPVRVFRFLVALQHGAGYASAIRLDPVQARVAPPAADPPDNATDMVIPANRSHRARDGIPTSIRSEEHTSELQSLMRISYAVFCLKKKKNTNITPLHSKRT